MRPASDLPPWTALELISLCCDGWDERLSVRVAELHAEGWSYAAIGRAMRLPRSTVRDLGNAPREVAS